MNDRHDPFPTEVLEPELSMIYPQSGTFIDFFHRHDFHVHHLYFYNCVISTYTLTTTEAAPGGEPGAFRGGGGEMVGGWATGGLPVKQFCQQGLHCRLAVINLMFLSYLSSIIPTYPLPISPSPVLRA